MCIAINLCPTCIDCREPLPCLLIGLETVVKAKYSHSPVVSLHSADSNTVRHNTATRTITVVQRDILNGSSDSLKKYKKALLNILFPSADWKVSTEVSAPDWTLILAPEVIGNLAPEIEV